jgi:hypothetical protein
MQWAFNQDIKPSSVKFVLVSLGDNAQVDGMAWPSIAALCQKTGQDRKTVIAALDRLEDCGYLKDSGKRTGHTGQIKVYQFNFERCKSTENGTVPKTEQYRISSETVPDFPIKSTEFPSKSTENGTRNPQEPKGTVKEPKNNKADDFDAIGFLMSKGVEKQIASDWLKVRKGKRLNPSLTAFEGLVREANKAQLSLQDAVKLCCERGWGALDASWLLPKQRGSPPEKHSRHSGFDKVNYSEGITEDGRIN